MSERYYRVTVYPVVNNGTDDVVPSDIDPITQFYGVNQTTILGLEGNSGEIDYSGMAEQFRIFAGGMKILPTIETITSSTTDAILNIWGGQVTPGELANITTPVALNKRVNGCHINDNNNNTGNIMYEQKVPDDIESCHGSLTQYVTLQTISNKVNQQVRRNSLTVNYKKNGIRKVTKEMALRRKLGLKELHGGLSVWSLVRNLDNVREYPNSEGCSVRYNPFQSVDQLDPVNIDTVQLDPASDRYADPHINSNDVTMPFVAIRFTNALSNTTTLPLKIYASWWLEACLIQPTPIYTERSPVEPNYDQIRSIVSNTNTFPTVTSGHTFLSFVAMLPTYVEAVKDVIEIAKDVVGVFKKNKTRVDKVKNAFRKKKKSSTRNGTLPGNATNDIMQTKTPNNKTNSTKPYVIRGVSTTVGGTGKAAERKRNKLRNSK
jgi:hypothetical protein